MFGFNKPQVPVPTPAQNNSREAMLQAIIASMEDALFVYDENFIVQFMNPAAEHLFGVKAADLVGKALTPREAEDPKLQRLVQIIFPTLAPSIIPRSKSGEYPQIVDISFEDPYLELRTSTSPIADPSGRVTGFMKIVRDRTREVSLTRTKTEFITVASHQLRTPITNLEWSIETMNGDATLSPETKGIVENALTSVHELRTIVEDLLNITKIEEGRFGYAFADTNLSEFTHKLLADVLPQAKRVGISLFFDPPQGELPKVKIDPQKISMVFRNLVDNAIRYNTANGSVTVAITKQANLPYLEVTVKDTGIGIPADQAQKLFTKFFRAGNAVSAVADGSGLGLYIAKNIIQSHGGQIWVESELNRGSTFHFTLPTDPTLIPPKEVPLEY
jgi:PAS domain S-box-containing protein